jgi:hypothetical protein
MLEGIWKLGPFDADYVEENGKLSKINYAQLAYNDHIEVSARLFTPLKDDSFLTRTKFDMKVILIEPSTVAISDISNGRVNFEDIHSVETYLKLASN